VEMVATTAQVPLLSLLLNLPLNLLLSLPPNLLLKVPLPSVESAANRARHARIRKRIVRITLHPAREKTIEY
jgi:hypothetical protein